MSRPGELDKTVSSDERESPTAPATTATPALPPAISRFSILSKIGEGGMGIVMLAADPMLGRNVAIKVLRDPRGAGDAERRQRFLREARAMAKISHENVIVVHEVGTHEGQDYVAMEYVAGTTLGRWQHGRPWNEVLGIYVRAGRGLAAAHAAGLVHRDFKPDNVLIGDDGRVRVMDFGLAVGAGDQPTRASAPPNLDASSLTRTGALLGTPRYMAPEQHASATVDARADQFAFCVALYEALYRQRPFRGETYDELVAAVQAGALVEPPTTEVPAAVQAALRRGLAPDREQRFATLDELLGVLAVAIAPPPPRRRAWTTAALGLAAVTISIVVAIAYKLRDDASRAHARAEELAASVADLKLKTSGLPAAADGEPTPSPRGVKHARIEFDDAEAAYKAGRYREASAAFLRAYTFQSYPSFLFNAAASLRAEFQHTNDAATGREAISLYRRYLELEPNAGDRVDVAKLVARIEFAIAH